jgi:putative flavoprotein involved in K+ transport
MNGTIFEVIVVGAGPSGLMCSYYLKHLGLEHMLFDQGRIGESWRSQRWNNFRMITPLRSSILPGALLKSRKPESFGTATEMATLLQEYVSTFQLPVTEQAQVISIEKAQNSPVFQVKVLHDNDTVRTYDAWQVVIAAGASNRPFIPPIAQSLPASVDQLHASSYVQEDHLKSGGVLVVGGGQSGLEIAQDLLQQGRKVWLSGTPHPQLPRQYRGKEIFQWLTDARLLDRSMSMPGLQKTPVISYAIDDDAILERSSLSTRGVHMLGMIASVEGSRLTFSGWALSDIEAALMASRSILQEIDHCIELQGVAAADAEGAIDLGPLPVTETLDLLAENINTIVWATGFTSSFSNIACPLTEGQLMNHDRGATAVEGLYVVGANRFAGTDYVVGSKEDASSVANLIYGVLR